MMVRQQQQQQQLLESTGGGGGRTPPAQLRVYENMADLGERTVYLVDFIEDSFGQTIRIRYPLLSSGHHNGVLPQCHDQAG